MNISAFFNRPAIRPTIPTRFLASSSFPRPLRPFLPFPAPFPAHRRPMMTGTPAALADPTPRPSVEPFTFGQAMPKKEIQALELLAKHPTYDGRGTVIAIFDSGVDPAAAGLQTTPDGRPKVLDLVDATGSGDVDTSTVVRLDAENTLTSPLTGTRMAVNPAWSNPSGEWRVGFKRLHELYSGALKGRVREARGRLWDEAQRRALAAAQADLAAFNRAHPPATASDADRKERAELEARVKLLGDLQGGREDLSPVIDCVVWRDGSDTWRVALDTRQLHYNPNDPAAEEAGYLDRFPAPLTNFRAERQFGTFSPLDALNFAVNVYEDGRVLSLVTDCSPHGTHVAGIAAAYHPEAPEMNGVAPGAQVISCKIGDHRLGSMETGPGLTRAIKACLDNGCDLVNMSYGEAAHLPNRGRFIELVEELVHKHNVLYVSSAGNAGPASSTLSSPGGTTAAILGVGAYVTPGLAAAGHSVCGDVEQGQQYTWSSRGPTLDGATGICISAPGGAVAPVPQWTSSKRQLMNGTSMSSPCACGGLALLVSALKQEGRPVTPARVRRAIENTARGLHPAAPADDPAAAALPGPWVLTSGRGLLQVHDALDYLRRAETCDAPDHWFQVKAWRVDLDAGSGGGRGIYLREPAACDRVTEHVVSVSMAQRQDADVRAEQWPLEARIALEVADPAASWVTCPPLLLLHNDGRVFRVRVDPRALPPGRLAYTEVLGFDADRRWRGPLFRVPITVCKPEGPDPQQPYMAKLGRLEFAPGEEVRRFLEVPAGATHARLRVSCTETPEHAPLSLYLRAAALTPQLRTSAAEFRQYQTLPEFSETEGTFPAAGGSTLEVTLAAFWSIRGRGAVQAEVEFFGLEPLGPSGGALVLPATAPASVVVRSALRSQKLSVKASLTALQWTLRPYEATLEPCRDARDTLPGGRTTSMLTLAYRLTASEAGKYTVRVPAIAGSLYDGVLDTSVIHIYGADKKLVSFVDSYAPDGLSLKKGEYVLRTVLRHEDVALLERFRDQALLVERSIDSIAVPAFPSLPDALTGGRALGDRPALLPGDQCRVTLGAVPEDKLPGDAREGRVLVGRVSYSAAGQPSYPLTYVVPPAKAKVNGNGASYRPADKAEEPPVADRLAHSVRDATLAFLRGLRLEDPETRALHRATLDAQMALHPAHLPLLQEALRRAHEEAEAAVKKEAAGAVKRPAWEAEPEEKESAGESTSAPTSPAPAPAPSPMVSALHEVLARSQAVVAAIDQTALAAMVARKCEEEGPGAALRRKKRDDEKAALTEALDKRVRALLELEKADPAAPVPALADGGASSLAPAAAVEEAWAELRRWADPAADSAFAVLQARVHERAGRYAQAIQALAKVAGDDGGGNGAAKEAQAYRAALLGKLGATWAHWAAHEKARAFDRYPPASGTSSGYPMQLT